MVGNIIHWSESSFGSIVRKSSGVVFDTILMEKHSTCAETYYLVEEEDGTIQIVRPASITKIIQTRFHER